MKKRIPSWFIMLGFGLALFTSLHQADAAVDRRGGGPLGGFVRSVLSPFGQTGPRMGLVVEEQALVSRLRIVFREAGLNEAELGRGDLVEIYNVHPRTEDLRSVVILKRTRRAGYRVVDVARDGTTIINRGRRRADFDTAMRHLRDLRFNDLILKKQIVAIRTLA